MLPEPEAMEASAPPEPAAMPEHVVILLLEAGERFLVKLDEALGFENPGMQEHFVKKLFAILDELHRRLNHDQGGELVENLIRLYAWWRAEILAAKDLSDPERLTRVRAQMSDIRQAWEQVLFKGEGMSENSEF